MNHREIQQNLHVARVALKDFYAATSEIDWAVENINWRNSSDRADKVPRQSQKNEATLRGQSKLAHHVMVHTMSLVQALWTQMGGTDTQSFWVQNREKMSNGIFDALEKTLEG